MNAPSRPASNSAKADPRVVHQVARGHAAPNPRRNPPKCRDCGYELTGYGIGDRCPECGATIRTLYDEPPRSNLANASVILGSISLASIPIACCGLWPVAIGFFVAAAAGMTCAMIARSRIRADGYRYSRSSRTITRVGFWLSTPGTVLTITAIVAMVYHAVV